MLFVKKKTKKKCFLALFFFIKPYLNLLLHNVLTQKRCFLLEKKDGSVILNLL